MTEAEKERAAVVAWLRSPSEFSGGLCDRFRAAWHIITNPHVFVFSVCLQLSDAIERRDHLKEQTDGQG